MTVFAHRPSCQCSDPLAFLTSLPLVPTSPSQLFSFPFYFPPGGQSRLQTQAFCFPFPRLLLHPDMPAAPPAHHFLSLPSLTDDALQSSALAS